METNLGWLVDVTRQRATSEVRCIPLRLLDCPQSDCRWSRISADLGLESLLVMETVRHVATVSPQCAECVDSAAEQHVRSTPFMVESMWQCCAVVSLTAWPALHDYGWCRRYGAVDLNSEKASLGAVVPDISGTTSTWSWSTNYKNLGQLLRSQKVMGHPQRSNSATLPPSCLTITC